MAELGTDQVHRRSFARQFGRVGVPEPHLRVGVACGSGAGEGIQTLDINLGKVALYQLSYARACGRQIIGTRR